jgi:hypothetical protein
MAEKIVFDEWRDSNEHRNYPFSDGATLTDGVNEIPQDLFVDARLYPIGAQGRVYLSNVRFDAPDVTLTISDTEVGVLATATFSLESLPDRVVFGDSLGRPAGLMIPVEAVGLAVFGSFGTGDTPFLVDQAEFAASVVVPTPEIGIRGLLLDDGTLFTGDIFLVGEDGIVLTDEGGFIRVDVVGDPFALQQLCIDELCGGDIANCDPATLKLLQFCGLRTINGVGPNDAGDFKLTIGSNKALENVLRIEQDGAILRIKSVGQRAFG